MLGVAAFILGIARKQYILSSTARDSLYSFYAADAGIECAAKNNAFRSLVINPTDPGGTGTPPKTVPPTDPVVCYNNTKNPTYTYTTSIAGSYPTYDVIVGYPDYEVKKTTGVWHTVLGTDPYFTLGYNDIATGALWGCARVSMDHFLDPSGTQVTVITSRGYNICDNVSGVYIPKADSPRTVERALQWTFK